MPLTHPLANDPHRPATAIFKAFTRS